MRTAVPSRKLLREFGLLVGSVIPVVFGWLIPALHGHAPVLWPLLIGLPAIGLALMTPGLLAFPYRCWMALGHGLGWINSHVILGLVFILVLQPIALVMRFRGHDPLRRRVRNKDSYRETRAHSSISLNRIF
ncbi:SxtJ family membrane protein [Cyanobium sp. LEGE 06113]|uniref:SxtJ family membrane protein n=1 Tax=Cyanobium sp. LEGE 06113 TaxID=1297573 RepID=UPI0018814150|nr:SxtJ family membrane protein [Cyanobium sp. LEGE 06113]MBE9152856.1 hypothetical protein [Cyanobium sp. LEGE 06113]MBE9152939.1 hypothetical protein [Cyanobium sp. LEGE 06113]